MKRQTDATVNNTNRTGKQGTALNMPVPARQIKLLTRSGMMRLLRSEGFRVQVYEGHDNYLSVEGISLKQLKELCRRYAMKGWYNSTSGMGIIGRWGHNRACPDTVAGLTTIKRGLRQSYRVDAKISKKTGVTLIVRDISERRFRRCLVEYGIRDFMYNYRCREGYILMGTGTYRA